MTAACFIRNTSIKALMQLLSEKGIISEEEFIARYNKLDREMKEEKKQILNGR